MIKVTVQSFASSFYGTRFPGFIPLWSLQSKLTRQFGAGELTNLEQDVEDRKSTEDLYLGLATQLENKDPSQRGSSDTAAMLPGLFADIDFASEKQSVKKYPPDLETAIAIIDTFPIKPYYIQNSGNGLHVIYKGDEPLQLNNREGRRKAQALSKAFGKKITAHFKAAGYEIDSVFDIARVFRAPGTLNHKGTLPKPVVPLRFDPNETFSWSTIEAYLVKEEPAANRANSDTTNRASHSAIRKACGWYGYITGEGAAAVDEPNWYTGASITARCSNGLATFLEYSRPHPDFDQREAEEKFNRAATESGPRTCEAVHDDLGYARFCDICPHYGTIRSPIQLGHPYDPALLVLSRSATARTTTLRSLIAGVTL